MENHKSNIKKNWHEKHEENLSFNHKISNFMAKSMGSWNFIIIQTIFVLIWVTLNIYGHIHHWDPFPFILLGLVFSIQAAYTAPIIMMAQNRQSERDRFQAEADYETNLKAKAEIEDLQKMIYKIEKEQLEEIKKLLKELKCNSEIIIQK